MVRVPRTKDDEISLELIALLVGLGTAIVGGYVVHDREITALQAQVDSLQRNASGMEQYLMDLYKETR